MRNFAGQIITTDLASNMKAIFGGDDYFGKIRTSSKIPPKFIR